MILVTLGTQKQSFKRLLDQVEKLKYDGEIIVQNGYTKFESNKMNLIPFMNYDKMNELITKSDVIITHGGTGSIVTPLKMGKKIIACARLEKYGEHVDDHQLDIVSTFAKEGYLIELRENKNLQEVFDNLNSFTPKSFISNSDNFKEKIKMEINKEVL